VTTTISIILMVTRDYFGGETEVVKNLFKSSIEYWFEYKEAHRQSYGCLIAMISVTKSLKVTIKHLRRVSFFRFPP